MKRYNIIMVYDQEFRRILFCKRKKRPYIGKLNFPGGKWEEGEEYIDAAYRELWEETGINIFGGDGNILHCYLMAERNRKLIFASDGV